MTLAIYNTLTKREQPFAPLDPDGKRVLFYSCGPTVYDYAHIGNFRSFLNADLLRRTLELLGFEVLQVMNLTDVGHMTEDDLADGGGEDKMQVAARRLAESKKAGKLPPGGSVDPGDPLAVSNFFAEAFIEDGRALGLKIVRDHETRPELMPRPTRYVAEMIELVQTLIDRGHAYVGADGVVYFDTQSFPAYGALSGNTLDKIRSGEGGRVDEATQALKRHPADFLLWKPDARHLMRWPSPWGEGYPGWHLECSVMAWRLLGRETNGVIDVHTGGEDNIFPHHECEIAQSCAASGEACFARYWMHTRFLLVDGEKMSKSKGNCYTLGDLLQRGATPAAVRLELIRMHYRSNANFTMQGIKDCQRQVERWARLERWLRDRRAITLQRPGPLERALPKFQAALCRDLNVSGALAALNEAAAEYDLSQEPAGGEGDGSYPETDTPLPARRLFADELRALRAMDGVLGVLDLEREASAASAGLDAEAIERRIAARQAARERKDWAEADRIRDELQQLGIELRDAPSGTTWTRVVS
jgi:cysteinyl-tRNA synthetase